MDYLLDLRLKPCSRTKCFSGQEMAPSIVINKTGHLDHHVAGVSEGKGELCLWLTGVSHN